MKLAIFKGVPALRSTLKEYHITTKGDAIKFLHLASIFGAKDLGERLKKEAKNHLLENCAECEVYESEGLSVKKITPKIRNYNDTPELRSAMKRVERAKEELKRAEQDVEAAQNKAGFTEQDGDSYFKAI